MNQDKTIPFVKRVRVWLEACFGVEMSDSIQERTHRFLEESLELGQACGCTKEEAHQLVEYVFNRKTGDVKQEVGGTMTTLNALCAALKLDPIELGEEELARCWIIIDKIRTKRAQKPEFGPLPIAIEAKTIDQCHPSHKTRIADSSSYDEVCVKCGATDIAGGGWGDLRFPCSIGGFYDQSR